MATRLLHFGALSACRRTVPEGDTRLTNFEMGVSRARASVTRDMYVVGVVRTP